MYIKVSKGGGTCINLPKAYCEELNIKPGDELDCEIVNGKIVLSAVEPRFDVVRREGESIVLRSSDGGYIIVSHTELAKLMVDHEARIQFIKRYKDGR